MRSLVLPAGLLCTALGLALGSAKTGGSILALAALAVTAATVAVLQVPATWTKTILLGCWASIVMNAASVYRVQALRTSVALALSLNASLWVGSLTGVSPSKGALLKALPWALLAFPAAWVRGRGSGLAVKVISSWLLAVALLAAALEFLPETPGYLPDHLE